MLRHAIYGLTCFAIASTAFGADNQIDGVYTGTAVLTSGGSAPPCSPGGDVTITIRGNDLKLADSQFHEFALRFDPDQNGAFITAYNGIADGVVDVRGSVAGYAIDLDTTNYGNGCAHHVHAEKKLPQNSK
jgi:hypothetical protein